MVLHWLRWTRYVSVSYLCMRLRVYVRGSAYVFCGPGPTCLLCSGVVPTTAGGEVIAAAIASNGKDDRYLLFQSHFPLKWAGWPFGTIGAQLFYWWLQARDEFQLMRQKYGV